MTAAGHRSTPEATTTTTTMTTKFTIVTHLGCVHVEADEYRLAEGDLYIYEEGEDDPVATFPEHEFNGVFRGEAGRFAPHP